MFKMHVAKIIGFVTLFWNNVARTISAGNVSKHIVVRAVVDLDFVQIKCC
jgi:hypothetical protein